MSWVENKSAKWEALEKKSFSFAIYGSIITGEPEVECNIPEKVS